jgi:hypothetical protein
MQLKRSERTTSPNSRGGDNMASQKVVDRPRRGTYNTVERERVTVELVCSEDITTLRLRVTAEEYRFLRKLQRLADVAAPRNAAVVKIEPGWPKKS